MSDIVLIFTKKHTYLMNNPAVELRGIADAVKVNVRGINPQRLNLKDAKKIMKLKEALQNMLFPLNIKCIACDNELNFNSQSGLCKDCEDGFDFFKNSTFCKRCGRALKANDTFCLECQAVLPPVLFARASFVYQEKVKKLIYALKFGNARFLAPYLARFMTDTYLKNEMKADLVTFVPMSKRKLRERGYNQAQLLANEVALRLNLPCVNVLDRVKEIKNTAKMSRSQRKEQLRDSVRVLEGIDFLQKRILLVDDVFTTGTTIYECAKKLKASGVSVVNALTFATSKAFVKHQKVMLSFKPFLS